MNLLTGDEAWEVDRFLHENPRRKRCAFAWLTDFVGWLPMPDGGEREAALTADHNAEMLEQRARLRWVRDRSVFVGDPDDVAPLPFGPGLPGIREWTVVNFDFAGYVTGFAPVSVEERAAVRRRLGRGADEPLCVVTVGGSGVGEPLLRRVPDAVPPACDLAVVQGGLTTCMELTAAARPVRRGPLPAVRGGGRPGCPRGDDREGGPVGHVPPGRDRWRGACRRAPVGAALSAGRTVSRGPPPQRVAGRGDGDHESQTWR